MQLSNERNKFEIDILGYEFPNSRDKHDANWLSVRLTAAKDNLSWTAVESCLRTFELVELRDWFENFISDGPTIENLHFTENELRFGFNNDNEVLVNLDFGFHPNGKNYNYGANEGCVLNFKLDEVNVNDVLKCLSKSIEKFPEKFF